MDQRSDDIRQGIESTRAALDEKLDTLETKTREIFDLKHHVAERPWTMLGLAVAAGYVLGSMGNGESESTTSYEPQSTIRYQPQTSSYQSQGTTTYKPVNTTYPTSTTAQAHETRSDSFFAQFDDEIAMLKQAALTTLREFLRDSIREYVPSMSRHMNQLQGRQEDSFTERSGPSTKTTHPYGTPTSADRDYVKTYHPPTETERERAVGSTEAL